MRLAILFLIVFFSLGLMGCPTPDSYIKSSEMALQNSANLDKNVEIVSSNYYNFIFKDTERLLKAGTMNEETRKEILENAKDQVTTLKEQSVLNKEFIKLAHDWVHTKGLKPDEILAVLKTVNQATPEVMKFLDSLKK
jgi:hypothetical protein